MGTCIDWLIRALHKDTMKECKNFINMTREAWHKKTLVCQTSKFERLCQRNKGGHSKQGYQGHGNHVNNSRSSEASNSNSRNSTRVRNMSSTSVTEVQENLQAQGPKFAVVPTCLPIGKYIATVEQACQQLKQGEAENCELK